jgi:vacuolar-type H+-ATPase subunit I/STV1
MNQLVALSYIQIQAFPQPWAVPYPIPRKYDPRHNDNLGKLGLLLGVISLVSIPLMLGLLNTMYMASSSVMCLLVPVLAWTSLILGMLASFRGSKWGYGAIIIGVVGVFVTSWIIVAILSAPGV